MELHPHPHLTGPHIPEPPIGCLRATGQVRETRMGFVCHPKQGPFSIPLYLLGPLFLLGGKRIGGPLLLVKPPPAVSPQGRQGAAPPVYLPLTFPDTP